MVSFANAHLLARPLELMCFVFPIDVLVELDPLPFHKLCINMHVNKQNLNETLL